DLSAPPVVKTIMRRALVVGVIASVIAVALGFSNPKAFFRGYLVSYMDWLCVCLGSTSILMIRHLTGGGWGMGSGRVVGAPMRTLQLLAVLFLPIAFLSVPKIYPWAMPFDAIQDPRIREHLEHSKFLTSGYLNWSSFVFPSAIYFIIGGLLVYLLPKWSTEQDSPPVRDNSARFKAISGPGLII